MSRVGLRKRSHREYESYGKREEESREKRKKEKNQGRNNVLGQN
jgi:hypothetical protein